MLPQPDYTINLNGNGINKDRTRVLLLAVRQALIMVLGALEDYLDMERSIIPKRKLSKHKSDY
jgi:hypothetical protein